MKHYVYFEVGGVCIVEVDADSADKAVELANEIVGKTDFSLNNVTWKAISAEDENGNSTEYCKDIYKHIYIPTEN